MMKVRFNIDYRTVWGQRLFICGSAKSLGSWNQAKAVPLVPTGGDQWSIAVEMDEAEGKSFDYKYYLLDERFGTTEWEFGDKRRQAVDPSLHGTVEVRDYWRPSINDQNLLNTSPFMQAFFKQKGKPKKNVVGGPGLSYRLQLRLPRVAEDYQVGVIGSHRVLGEWKEEKVVLMGNGQFPVWELDVHFALKELPVEYKYVLYNTKTKRVEEWEGGENRYLPRSASAQEGVLTIQADEYFRFQSGNWRGAGVAIPVFSLRSESGTGVGEFEDIKKLVDWSVKTGNKLIQVLPVNDTIASHSWVDSYPYAGISVFALHPIYANLQLMGALSDGKRQKEFDKKRIALNRLDHVDHEQVMNTKAEYFKLAYAEHKEVVLKSKEFKTFFAQNGHWLLPYAVFSCLRDRFGTPDFSQWPQYSVYSEKEIAKFADPKQKHYDDVAIHYFIQFHLDKQLKEATEYARQKGVVLKGDIPIGIFRNSVDAWIAPRLYNMDCQAGAPPDDFSVTGQNWGFPTYNWEEMAKDDYAWWKERLKKMADYFDVFRIDHILGFFRIWEIPMHAVEGLFGHFNPCLPFSVAELGNWGLQFNKERYCEPYIRAYMLSEIFGTHSDKVSETYLEEFEEGKYRFKEQYNTQRKLSAHIEEIMQSGNADNEHLIWLQSQLFRLHAEVLFLPTDDASLFNPRIGFHSTYSYRDLDDKSKEVMNRLYVHYFYKRHNDFWKDRAMEKLPALKAATNMLICGEDLGMVPESVPGVMTELQILSLAVQRMPNNPDWEFWPPSQTPYLSVTTTSSHDTSTLRGWWEEDRQEVQRFFNSILRQTGEAPVHCEPWIASEIIRQHMEAPAMWAIFPIQDLLAMDKRLRRPSSSEERINVPANPQHYWKYRLHLTLEELLKEDDFSTYLRKLADESGRIRPY
ncbi:4-alpha-glucanotransferase [uncultured Imperialibacter sp.]|uniref:4-alpha-glucanotransferase n=1 Tax=uncultured Imperialibacter sp. TaxID=1672639 RepID=UPI0030DCCDC1|tara:strand:- start:2219 stop:4951 length:2733 start_codon:yes stop_codon:yes gene_type:complete